MRYRLLVLLPLAAALLYGLGGFPLLEDPNDGQYAEVAREMFERGAWVSPTLNGVLFLNKPPLLYWFIEIGYAMFGVGEFAARLPGALAALATVVLIARLGAELSGERAGWLSACAYVAMTSIFVEARFVRPDSLLVLAVTGVLYGFVLAFRGGTVEARRGLLWMQGALAAGVLAKGVIAVLLPGMAIFCVCAAERRFDFLARLLRPRAWLLFVALVAPWHVLAAWRHEGFAWDYIVNQHFLFFLDKKEPRDSIPIPLVEFWGVFLGRAHPWTLFLPPILLHAVGRLRGERRWQHLLLLSWFGGTLLFFSVNVSRLEHYALPALPAVALLAGGYLDSFGAGERSRRFGLYAAGFLLAAILLAALLAAPRLVAEVAWLAPAGDLPAVAREAMAVALAGALAALAAARRRIEWFVPVLAAASLVLVPVVQRGLAAVAPLDSSKPVADLLERSGADGAEVVFEAPVEYQHVAGLVFYLRRPVRLVRPPGFVDPDYLVPHSGELFLGPGELERLWASRPAFFVSDPLRERPVEAARIAPGAFEVVGFVGNRWILRNRVAVPQRSGSSAPRGPESARGMRARKPELTCSRGLC